MAKAALTAFEKYAKGSQLQDMELPNTNAIRIDSLLDFADFSDGEWHQIRLWPGTFASATLWMDIKKKDGSFTQIPRTCLNFDIEKASFDTSKRCPYYEARDQLSCRGEQGAQLNVHYFCNILVRDLQNDEPRKTKITSDEQESGFKNKNSKSWTPIRVARFPKTVIEKLLKLRELNRVNGEIQELSDPENGRDIFVLFNRNSKNPANMWDTQLSPDGSSKLTKKEKDYLFYDIKTALETIQQQQTVAEAEKWMERHLEMMSESGAQKKKKDKAKTGKSKSDAETNVSVNELLGKSKKKKKDSKESNSPKAPKKDKKDKKLDPENVVDVKPKKKKKKDQSVDEKPDKKADKNDKSSKNDSDDKAKKKKSKNTGDDTVKNGKNKKNKDTGNGKNKKSKKPKYDFKF